MKICKKCNKIKELAEFNKNSTLKDGYAKICRDCINLHRRNFYSLNKEKYRNKENKYRQREDVKEKSRTRCREYYKNNKERFERDKLKKFNISLETYNEILTSQLGVCKICEKHCKSGRRLAVDHCHKTGKIRGLLCAKCNRGIGMFDDDRKLLLKAIEYLSNDR